MIRKILFSLFRYFPFRKYRITGNSMQPFLAHGDTVLVNIFSYIFHDPSVGDVAVLRSPTDMVVIKRITRRKNNLYFVRGDNQKESTDSRVFGWIERKEIAGKVMTRMSRTN